MFVHPNNRRVSNIFINRNTRTNYNFLKVYDAYLTRPEDFKQTNTTTPFTELNYKEPILEFSSKSGILTVEKNEDWYTLNFPSEEIKEIVASTHQRGVLGGIGGFSSHNHQMHSICSH